MELLRNFWSFSEIQPSFRAKLLRNLAFIFSVIVLALHRSYSPTSVVNNFSGFRQHCLKISLDIVRNSLHFFCHENVFIFAVIFGRSVGTFEVRNGSICSLNCLEYICRNRPPFLSKSVPDCPVFLQNSL